MKKLYCLKILIFLFFLSQACAQSNRLPMKKNAPHHTEKGFTNPYLEAQKKDFFSFLKARFLGEEEWADYAKNRYKVPTQQADLFRIQNPPEAPQVTWIGHSTFLIQYRGVNFLTDPIFSDFASPVSFAGPKRVHAPALRMQDLPPIDFVVISHNHYDHLDFSTVEQINNQTLWLVPLNHRTWFQNAGVSEEKIIEMDWWDSVEKSGVTITATPSQHWSGRSLWDRFDSLWASWVIEIDGWVVWFGGDTGYNPHQFKEIGEKFPPFDLALIPIGAYAPRWFMKDMHVNPEEAVQIHQDLQAQYSIGIHWGTFPLTAEPIEEPPVRLKSALEEKNIPSAAFETLKIGETRTLPINKEAPKITAQIQSEQQ